MPRLENRVIVIGAGVVGVTTAYFLAKSGFEVIVLERQPGPALETSFANAGEISPGYASPWAAPDIPRKIPGWLMMRHAPLILRPKLDPAMITWMLRMLKNCTAQRYSTNKARMVRLALYSQQKLAILRQSTGISYDQRALGTLQLFRKQSQLDGIAKDVKVLERDGVAFEVLDRQGCIAVEPGLAASKEAIAGGLRLPGDETGDCHKFTTALAQLAEQAGVRFEYETSVDRLVMNAGMLDRVVTDRGDFIADRFIIAAGSHSPRLTRQLGITLPVFPVKGYSLTMPVIDDALAPQSTLLDESYKVAITRLGDRIRVGGMAEISGYGLAIGESRKQTLLHSVRSLFPGADRSDEAEFWSGLRPMTPDGTPIIGKSPVPNVYLNTGHGTLGWTMACGSAAVLNDLLVGRPPEIESADLGLSRYQ
jgi:D-amino-acid dehydrogenase